MWKKYSIILPTYNRIGLLQKTIYSLLHQDLDTSLYEIIIMDDNSDDGTQEIVENLAQKHTNIRYYRNETNEWPWYNRNKWSSLSHWEIIIQTEDDATYPNNYLFEIDKEIRRLQNNREQRGTLIVLPRRTQNFDEWIIPKLVEFRRNAIDKLSAIWKREIIWWRIFRKDIYQKAWWYRCLQIGEDTDLVKRINRMWLKSFAIYDTFRFHYEPNSFLKLFKRMYRQWFYYKEYKNTFKPELGLTWKTFWMGLLIVPIWLIMLSIYRAGGAFLLCLLPLCYIFLAILTLINQEIRLSYKLILKSKYKYLMLCNPVYYGTEIYWILSWRLVRSMQERKNLIF